MTTTRRRFLQGLGLASAVPAVNAEANTADAATDPMHASKRAVFLDMPYYSLDGTGWSYTPPAGNHATREYCAGLSDEEFLRRHWIR